MCRLLHLKWSDMVTNTTLWKWTKQLPTAHEIKKKKTENMEVDRTHTQETSRNHHPSSHHMEPPREQVKGKAIEPLAKRHRNKRDGIHQERDGEDGHRQTTVAFLGRWPMLPGPASKQA